MRDNAPGEASGIQLGEPLWQMVAVYLKRAERLLLEERHQQPLRGMRSTDLYGGE